MQSSRPPTNEERAIEHLRDLETGWGAQRAETELLRLHARRERQSRRKVVVTGTLLAAAAAVVFWLRVPQPQSTVAESRASQVLAAVEQTKVKPIVFADGSSLTPSTHGQVIVQNAGDSGVRAALEGGKVHARVTPNRAREFVVHAGLVDVIVLGTEFDVERLDDGRTRVAVMHGHVRVAWSEGSHDLHKGEEGIFPPTATAVEDAALAFEASASETTAIDAGLASGLDAGRVMLSPVRVRAQRRRQWRRLASRGGYDEAYAIIEAEGDAVVHDKVDDLLLAADAARLSGHPAHALKFLDKILARYSKDERAPMAAFTKGRLLLASGQSAGAARSFEQALKLGASGSLHENALARAVEAHARSGNEGAAKKLATKYLSRYPDGKWVTSVRKRGALP